MSLNPDFFKKLNINFDLAIEAQEVLRGQADREVPGVSEEKETTTYAAITTVKVLNEQGVQYIGKPQGTYITIECPSIRDRSPEVEKELVSVLSAKITSLLQLGPMSPVLVVGLGNWHATPDSLGPKAMDFIPITRHLHQHAPEHLVPGMRPVSAIAPGVLGITGIETAEIIKGIADKTKPELIIAIDSLAARSLERICTTIQIADTGINPGSGIGNQRLGINLETMGIPVLAIGIPTVVHAATIATDANINFYHQLEGNPGMARVYKRFPQEVMEQSIEQILKPFGGNLIVTPKEIDNLILYTSRVVAGGITTALYPGIKPEEYSMYLQ